MEMNNASTIAVMADIWAKMYYAFALELTESLGENKGKKILIKCIRKYAQIRGKAVAKRVETLKLEHTAENFVKYYDSPFADIQKACVSLYPDKKLAPSSGTTFCPYKEMWDALPYGRKFARIYCEEFHKEMWRSYHPDLRVRQDEIMTKGDEKCTFHTYMLGDEHRPVLIFDQK